MKTAENSSQTTTSITIKPQRVERGTGSTITIDLSEYPGLLAKIRTAAKDDDREPSKYLRRRLVQFDAQGILIPEASKQPKLGDDF